MLNKMVPTLFHNPKHQIISCLYSFFFNVTRFYIFEIINTILCNSLLLKCQIILRQHDLTFLLKIKTLDYPILKIFQITCPNSMILNINNEFCETQAFSLNRIRYFQRSPSKRTSDTRQRRRGLLISASLPEDPDDPTLSFTKKVTMLTCYTSFRYPVPELMM